MQPRSDDPALPVRLARLLLAVCTLYAALVSIILAAFATIPRAAASVHAEQIEPLFSAMIGHGAVAVLCAAAMLALRRRKAMSPRTLRVLLVLATFGWLLSADRIANVIYPAPLSRNGVFRLHPGRGWAHIPGVEAFLATRVRIDEHGLRVPETGPIREIQGKRRILFVGDSVTFGYGHLAAVSYCEQTVDLLNRRHPELPLACLNGGVTGYDPGQEYDFLIDEGLVLKPALVVLQLCLNDVTHQFDRAASNDEDRHPEYTQIVPPDHWSGLHRLAIRLGKWLRVDEQAALAAAERTQHFQFEELLAPVRSDRVDQAWRRTLSQVDAIVDACRERELPLVIICFPAWRQVVSPDASLEPQAVFAELAGRRVVPFVDVLPAWEMHTPRGPQAAASLLFDDTHPTELGHRLAAETLADELQASGLLGETAKR